MSNTLTTTKIATGDTFTAILTWIGMARFNLIILSGQFVFVVEVCFKQQTNKKKNYYVKKGIATSLHFTSTSVGSQHFYSPGCIRIVAFNFK